MPAKTDVEKALATLGISGAELQEFVQKKASSRPVLEVTENKGEELKFGVVTISKVHRNGYRKSTGYTDDQVDLIIEKLTAFRAANPR